MVGRRANTSDPLCLRAGVCPAAVGELRRNVAAHLRERGLGPEVVGAVQMTVSEAVTNVVLHAYEPDEPTPTSWVTVDLEVVDDVVGLVVTDSGRGITPRPDSPGAGFGLAIIAGLADRLELSTGPGGQGTRLSASFTAR
jgi:anti-sigma regulatory factor (Ser/Thr protein kinase)